MDNSLKRSRSILSGPVKPSTILISLLLCNDKFLMTDSICHSSLRRAVLETVALTSIEFCTNPRKKVDRVCILVRH